MMNQRKRGKSQDYVNKRVCDGGNIGGGLHNIAIVCSVKPLAVMMGYCTHPEEDSEKADNLKNHHATTKSSGTMRTAKKNAYAR